MEINYASAAKSRLIKNITEKKIQNNQKKENKTKKTPFAVLPFTVVLLFCLVLVLMLGCEYKCCLMSLENIL